MNDKILAAINIETETEPITVSKEDLENIWKRSFIMTTTDNKRFYFNIIPLITDNTIQLKVNKPAAADEPPYEFIMEEENLTDHAKLLLDSLKDDIFNQSIPYIDDVINKIKRQIQLDYLTTKEPKLFRDIILNGKGIIKINNKLADIFGSISFSLFGGCPKFFCDNAIRGINEPFLKGKMIEIYFVMNDSKTIFNPFGPSTCVIPQKDIYNEHQYIFDHMGTSIVKNPDVIFSDIMSYTDDTREEFIKKGIRILNNTQEIRKSAIDIF